METDIETEHAALAAHWMLGRLTVARAVLAHLERSDGHDELAEHLVRRAKRALDEIHAALEDQARGVPALASTLRDPEPSNLPDIVIDVD